MEKYTERGVVDILLKKRNIKIRMQDKVIWHLNRNNLGINSVGNGSLGKIDYLRSIHKYTYINLKDTKDNRALFKKYRVETH